MAKHRLSTPDRRRSGVLVCAGVVSTLIAVLVAPGTSAQAAPRVSIVAASAGAQHLVDKTSAAYVESRQRVESLSVQVQRLTANADDADQTATALRDKVTGEQAGGVLHALGDFLSPGESDVDRAADAAQNAEDARRLADVAQAALDQAIAQTEVARQAWEKAQLELERVEATWSAQQVVSSAVRRSQPTAGYDVADPAQDHRNRHALRAWTQYLNQLARAGVVPPPARDLADPSKLPSGLQPMQVVGHPAMRGVAAARLPDGRPVTVLPAETIRAVSDAFHRLGQTGAADGIDAATYACGGLAANVWGTSNTVLPADAAGQLTDLPLASRSLVQVGDLVVLGGKKAGLGQTGVYVGDGFGIVADPTTGSAGVQRVGPNALLAARRPSLVAGGLSSPSHSAIHVPTGGVCGPEPVGTSGTSDTTGATSGSNGAIGDSPLALPMSPGSYRLSAGFGSAGGMWSSGQHTGQDFAAPIGTPVLAAGAGVVTIEHPSWAGNLVRIDHGGGVATLYAHLSRVDVTAGQTVSAGDQVGLVGNLGNTTGPHLHFEVRLDDVPVDPALVLDIPEAPHPVYTNGEIPTSALCAATPDGVQQLSCDAAVGYRLMAAAFERDNGEPMCITDSYRSRDGQEQAHLLKPNLTATPGTSVHGMGRAVDLCGGIESFATPEHAWMERHGPDFGWIHPSWAAAGGTRPEPWHFEYEG